ncbi:MAG: tetraacyldisaccharide 4'-kinase [Rhodospirillales bacterium]|nr:tetraacyldisaccharide 4'-kinase [Rhodospirillales bacterium]
MTLKTPSFWYRPADSTPPLKEQLLFPVSALYKLLYDAHHVLRNPYKASIPVLCIGNLVAGGTGKTPTSLALLKTLKGHNIAQNPAFLIRGYGGAETGPLRVDPRMHTAWDVGDEALILAQAAPTYIGGNRAASAQMAAENGADIIIMDDGLQNPGIHKDLRLVVVNGEMGFGNKKLMPAGPLRQPLNKDYSMADGVILIGRDTRGALDAFPEDKPLIRAHLEAQASCHIDTQTPYLAFAGLGYPEKFFRYLKDTLKMNIVSCVPFSDHHPYSRHDIKDLHEQAQELGARLITTEKDYLRLPHLKKIHIETLPIEMCWENEEALVKLLQNRLHPPS